MKRNNTLLGCTKTALVIISLVSFAACGSSKKINTNYLYFRDGADTVLVKQQDLLIQENDLLSIQVFSKTLNQEQAAIFNMPASGNELIIQGYQVNQSGNIEMPVIGSVKAAGLSKEQLQISLTEKLNEYVKNPSVIVRFLQFNVNVLGEVKTPGIQKFFVDKVTIIDALSAAGDLTDYGKREDISVVREDEGKRKFYTIDLRDKNLFTSPAYLLHPNDVIYVGPNKIKLKSMNLDPESQRKTGLFFSIASIFLSIGTIIVLAVRN